MFETPGQKATREAASDMSTLQYRFVKLDSSGRVTPITAITDKAFGILQNKPHGLGVAAEIMLNGISQVVGGANAAKGDKVGHDNAGRAIAIVPGTATTQYLYGEFLEDPDNAGEIGAISFDCLNAGRAA